MIIIDSSVWIDFLKGRDLPQVSRLRRLFGKGQIALGDLMLCEVLQGIPTDKEALLVEHQLRRFRIVRMVDDLTAVVAAANYRKLRSLGITIRSVVDLFIGTWCITNGVPILHNDRDFMLMAHHLGLIELSMEEPEKGI